MQTPKTDFDAIVVGTGPGGATVARDLTLNGKKVLILEWGDNNPTKGSAAQVIPQACIPGKSMLITSDLLGMVRAITTGGSSMIYCATAFPAPVDMLKTYGVDISAEADEIRKEVPMDPLCDELMMAGPRAFMESALELGYDCHKLNKFIYQNKCRAKCQLCSYGCPYGAKWNARHFVDEALKNGAKMINYAKVEKVLIENKKAVGVQYRHNKETFHAYAPTVIVAAGGIGSPLILRESGMRSTGYDFFFDPLVFVYGTIKGLGNGKAVPMSSGVHFPEDGIVMTDFNQPHLLKILIDLEVFKFKQAFKYKDVLPIMIKIRDDMSGGLTKRGWVDKKLTKDDRLKLDKGVEHAKRVLRNAGATDIYRGWMFAAHPGGTVKIGEHVDTNLKTKFDNLYVCDCSVIPQEWGLPPTTTILSLGKRLAKHLLAGETVSAGKGKTMAALPETDQPEDATARVVMQ
ncbi:MAG: glucose-methanol-choline oxidoreductase [Desulfobacterales bacterium CG23_combo_of_CG06-09_8_20_14_all_51_8]|nr:MAG: glucose-methanol-choline oxidoreductase [Desulfobacterales bacterium CG23_combo_of_CG06-09_8_20_14_all_51_8]